ncbi:MAG: hypothetical protein R6V58_03880 [Planctomycetota bacterium]
MAGRGAMDVKLNVKPVSVQLLHSGIYEGPCRVGRDEDLDPEEEKRRGEERFQNWVQQLKTEISDHVRLLEPVRIQWKDDWHLPEGELAKLDEDARSTDVFLIGPGGLRQYPSVAIARRFRKPIVMVGTVGTIDVAAHLRSRGLEGYSVLDVDDLNRLISLLRARKAISAMKILHALEGDTIPVGVVSTIYDMEDLRDRLGVRRQSVPATRLLDRMDALSGDDAAEAEQLTDDLMEGAERCEMSRENILPSVRFYVAAKRMMGERECNAFTVPCFELCARRMPERHKVTFCLTHSLLKDGGYPAACEGDVNVLMAIATLMYVSGKSPYMGNCALLSKPENQVRIVHSVPGLKMKGLDEPSLPYAITSFTTGGWGVTLRYDFSRDVGEPVTIARFDPTARKLLVAAGEIVGGEGYEKIGCSVGVHLGLRDVVDFFDQQQDFGHHMAMVYGDYTDDLRRLGRLMDIAVVEA